VGESVRKMRKAHDKVILERIHLRAMPRDIIDLVSGGSQIYEHGKPISGGGGPDPGFVIVIFISIFTAPIPPK